MDDILVFNIFFGLVAYGPMVGKAVIGGVKCDHLLFSRPGVDFQVRVAGSGQPLPMKYVVTDTATRLPSPRVKGRLASSIGVLLGAKTEM